MGRRTCESLFHTGDSNSKSYHHLFKKSNDLWEKTKKKKAGEDEFVGFRKKRIEWISSYFVLTGFASFTTSRTGYFASVSGTVNIVPVRITGESVIAKSAGTATAMASPSFLP